MSYEVRFALVIIFFLITGETLRLRVINLENRYWLKGLIFLPMVFLWLIIRLAETNRTPFDFAEGESELVSGFNIEYGRVGFALIFIAEYARIYFMSCLITLIFFRVKVFSIRFFVVSTGVVFV